MADTGTKQKFPMISITHWWTLRDKFKASLPRAGVTAMYLATALSVNGREMTEASARTNVLPPLKIMGLVQEDGSLNEELANLWRTDEGYSTACSRILEDVYPQELLDALPPPSPDLGAAQNWFMSRARVGQAAGKRMAETYRLLCDADYTAKEVAKPSSQTTSRVRKTAPTQRAKTSQNSTTSGSDIPKVDASANVRLTRPQPAIHVNIQIHISPDSSNEQIETIFANMARYLFDGETVNE